jgi:predicted transcriptional regulator
MLEVLTALVANKNQPMNKKAILRNTTIAERSYTHTVVMLNEHGFITNGPDNRRIKSWTATTEGFDWLRNNQIGEPEQPSDNFNKTNRHESAGMARFAPEIQFVPSQSLAPAGSVSNGDVVRLNITDIIRFSNAIIGDRSHGEISWVRDGKHYSVQVNDGEVHLFLEGGN